MPSETTILEDDAIVLAGFIGDVTGQEVIAWRRGLSARLDAGRYHIV